MNNGNIANYLRPVQGQPLRGAAVVAARLSQRRAWGGTGRVIQDLLLGCGDPPFA